MLFEPQEGEIEIFKLQVDWNCFSTTSCAGQDLHACVGPVFQRDERKVDWCYRHLAAIWFCSTALDSLCHSSDVAVGGSPAPKRCWGSKFLQLRSNFIQVPSQLFASFPGSTSLSKSFGFRMALSCTTLTAKRVCQRSACGTPKLSTLFGPQFIIFSSFSCTLWCWDPEMILWCKSLSAEAGEQVEYWSQSSKRWMPAIAARHRWAAQCLNMWHTFWHHLLTVSTVSYRVLLCKAGIKSIKSLPLSVNLPTGRETSSRCQDLSHTTRIL